MDLIMNLPKNSEVKLDADNPRVVSQGASG